MFKRIVLCEGGGGGGGVKITIVVINDSLVIFWTVFTSVPITFDLYCKSLNA